MRTAQEIKNSPLGFDALTLEVLLDIRELVIKGIKKDVPKKKRRQAKEKCQSLNSSANVDTGLKGC